MQKQRDRPRPARENRETIQVQNGVFTDTKDETPFTGYQEASVKTNILYIVTEDIVEKVQAGETAMVILQTTPFYAESGGQTADIGWIYTNNGKAKVSDVQTAPNGQHLHQIEVTAGYLQADRKSTRLNS